MQTTHDTPTPNPLATDAWHVWEELNKMADLLWNTYEQDFLEFCYQEACEHDPQPSVSTENDQPF